jgi:hypothetical protein
VIRTVAALLAAIAAWLTFGALAVTGPGPDTPRVGVLPPWWLLAAFVTVAVVSCFVLRASAFAKATADKSGFAKATADKSSFVLRASPVVGLLVLPWLPFGVPRAFLVWTGPLAYAVWAAVAATLIVSASGRMRWFTRRSPALSNPARAPWIVAAAAAIWFGIVAAGAAPMRPGGDEPHYLVITQSLLYDGDIKIENNHARRDYAPYFPDTLRPHYMGIRGTDGEIYSIHAPGLSAIVAPAFAVGGYRAVVIFLIGIAAAGTALLWRLSWLVSGDAGAAWFGTLAVACSTPIAFHSFAVFPDLPAAVLTLAGVWALIRAGARAQSWLLHGVALALLPWLHSRLAAVSGLLGLMILLRMPRSRTGVRTAGMFLAIPIVSAALWFWSFYAIYGTPNPEAPYGTFARTQASLAFIPDGLLGVLFDQQFGLLLYAPVFLVAFAGAVAALRGPARRLTIELAILSVPYMMNVTYLRMWWGGWSAPVRLSVPLLMIGGIFAAVAWREMKERGTRAAAVAALLVTAYTTLALAIVQRGRLAFNVRDGYSLWLQWLTPLADLPRGFPSFFRGSAAELVLHAGIWLALLVLAWLTLRRLARSRLQDRGALAAVTAVAFALAAMLALTIVWRVDDAPAVDAATAQVALLRSAAAGNAIGVRLSAPRAVTSSASVVSSLAIGPTARGLADRDRPLFTLGGPVPAGRYRLMGAHEPLALRIARREDPIVTVQQDETVVLPVDVPALIVHGPPADRPILLAPRTVGPIFEDAPRADRARRYGSTIVYFLDGNSFAEREAFWVRGSSGADIVIQPAGSASAARVLLRNGAVRNGVSMTSGTWKDDQSLAPGQEREMMLPLDASRGATRFRIESAAGFRPSEVDRSSTDSRFLGVWVQFR